jgi:hypothetical protein
LAVKRVVGTADGGCPVQIPVHALH